jgi:hypothetical protein
MKINIKTALKWAGIDLGNPISLITQLLPMIGFTTIQNEAESYFSKHITSQRRVQLVSELRGMADNLEKGQNIQAAKGLVDLLKQIKF